MDGVVIPVARMIVELEHNYNTDIVTILLPQEEEINDLEMHRKQETVTLREVMVCTWHFIFRLKGARNLNLIHILCSIWLFVNSFC